MLRVAEPALALAPAWRWPIIAVALILAAMDLADGRLARWRGEASRFGAVVDGETDAFYVLVLAVMALQEGRVSGAPDGGVVLAIGLLRYVMLGAQAIWSRLRGHVPSSPIAKAICAAQIGALIWALAPGTQARDVLCWIALGGLVWSFGRDVRYLLRGQRQGT